MIEENKHGFCEGLQEGSVMVRNVLLHERSKSMMYSYTCILARECVCVCVYVYVDVSVYVYVYTHKLSSIRTCIHIRTHRHIRRSRFYMHFVRGPTSSSAFATSGNLLAASLECIFQLPRAGSACIRVYRKNAFWAVGLRGLCTEVFGYMTVRTA